jgi:undecaprenyl diphosphate synthase
MNEHTKTPQCVGFIMDGNRRWAKERGLETLAGHTAGYETLRKLVVVAAEMQIPHVVCYAFSTENWSRAPEDVSYLMSLILMALQKHLADPAVRIRFIGEKKWLDQTLLDTMKAVEITDKPHANITLWVALSYGGRAEIVSATNQAILRGIPVTEETFAESLWTHEMPDPDLIIRTSGERRLSNFLLWQSAYSELFFTETLWPDFGESEFKGMVEAYANRERRHGA